MNQKLIQFQDAMHIKIKLARRQIADAVRRYWFRVFLLGLAAFLVNRKDLSIDLHLNAVQQTSAFFGSGEEVAEEEPARPMNTSLLSPGGGEAKSRREARDSDTGKTSAGAANGESGFDLGAKAPEDYEKERARQEKRKKQLQYVKRYAKVAQNEMARYGIPASIKLAQGLLESDIGQSRLAKNNNNHFGIKCFSRSCAKGHCSNFSDDHHKDFFRIYKNAWESYRAHSNLLQKDRYQPLFDLEKTDYKGWAYGLKKAGYATDRNYAEKLINLIEDLELHLYDH
jgi:flagellum-specific peptidoglycan hydrolase FlgJ